jgi:basic membrane protein A
MKYLHFLRWFVVACIIVPGFFGSDIAMAQDDKMAVIFPGSIQDADYNAIGYMTMQEVKKELGIETAYSQKVAVPDAPRVASEYAESGYNIIWAHGAQFNNGITEVAGNYPDVTFILEADAPFADPLPNAIVLGRNYFYGFYVLGALAAKVTETGQIGYVGGLELPFTYGELNAIYQALQEYNPDANIHYLYAGDFNDPTKARQVTEALISKDCDVIISAVNLGNYGLFKAVEKAERPVWVTTTYTDKHKLAPNNHLTADLFNFTPPVLKAIEMLKEGTTSAYIPMVFGEGKGRYIKFPVDNVSEELSAEIQAIADKVASGEIEVVKNLKSLDFE